MRKKAIHSVKHNIQRRKLIIWAIVMLVIIIVSLFDNHDNNDATTLQPADSLLVINCDGLQQVNYCGFTVYYNKRWHLPACVAYEITDAETHGKLPRTDNWKSDDTVKGCAQVADYVHSGYDRGHMVPAGDLKWDKTAMEHSFYLTNACPQNHSLNEGAWNKLENKVREWARRDGSLIVMTGPIVTRGNTSTIGRSHVRVPSSFYKIILAHHETPMRVVAFILPNEDANKDLASHATTVRNIEHLTGINFFETLPTAEQDRLETSVHLHSWLH